MGKPASRLGDNHVCPMVTGVVPHVGGPVLSVSQATVLIGGRPAARVGDTLTCVGPPDTIMEGEPTVWISGRPASRIGDSTLHGGKIVLGDFTVLIGGKNTVPPSSMAECEKRLAEAQKQLATEPYKPVYSEMQLHDIVESNDANERFLVSFQAKKKPDKTVAYKRDSGRAPLWTCGFTMLENAGLTPELIAGALGTQYDPGKEYAVYIIDQGEDYAAAKGVITPTWENMKELTKREFPKSPPEVIDEVLTPEYQQEYSKTIKEDMAKTMYSKTGKPIDRYEELEVEEFKRKQFVGNPEAKGKFTTRHLCLTELGANDDFLGTGLTKDTRPEATQESGVAEILRLEHNPPAIAELEKQGLLRVVPCVIN